MKAQGNGRNYARAAVRLKARLSVGTGAVKQFEATLNTRDISVGGMFFESTFFLKLGQAVDVQLTLPPENRDVRARGRIIRVETRDARGKEAGGFAVRFEEYVDHSDIAIANYFMAHVLQGFVQDYTKKRKVQFSPAQVKDIVDVLAAWELSRTEGGIPLWEPRGHGDD